VEGQVSRPAATGFFVSAADDFENGHRLGFASHHDFAQRPELVSADQALPCSFTDEDPQDLQLGDSASDSAAAEQVSILSALTDDERAELARGA
jgi:hypothetical protein